MDNEEHGVWGGVTAPRRAEMRGTATFVSVEDRRLADRVRADVARDIGLANVAAREGVTLRTLERWLTAQREAA